MNTTTQIFDGLQLMLIGMSTVFVFLSILVIILNLFKVIFSQEVDTASSAKNDLVSDDEVAAISGAIHQHRQNNNKTKGSK